MCLHPKVISYRSRLNPKTKSDTRVYGSRHSVLVTCGKCDECLKRYQNDWMIRNYMQFRESKVAVFFTLTYREDAVPLSAPLDDGEARSVCKRDVQLFLKRFREFRRKQGLSTDFKWFITSEYGPTTLRPHYHGLLHGIRLSEFQRFVSSWRREYGFTTQREISAIDVKNSLTSARYTAKYCAKGDFENPLVALGLVEPTFHLISNGLGKTYVNSRTKSYHLALDFPNKLDSDGSYSRSYLEEIFRRSRIPIGKFAYAMPRYYRAQFFAQRKDLQIAYSDFICQKFLDEYEGELEIIQTEKPDRTRYEASVIHFNETLAAECQRATDARQSITKYFKQSKL